MSVESPIASTDHVFIGEDRTFQFPIKNSTGGVQDITNWAVTFEVRAFAGSATALLSKTVGMGVTLTDPTNGVLQVRLLRADTVDVNGAVLIQPGRYVYALHRTDSGAATELAFGDFVLLEAASR